MYPPEGGFGPGPQQPGYAQQPTQGYPPQGGYPPQYGGYQNKPVPESSHEHPLNYLDRIRGKCKNCNRPMRDEPGYQCNVCGLILDMQCSDKIFYGNKRKECHPHPLALRIRESWRCDICKRRYRDQCSFFCKPCDFDICDKCYLIY